MEVDRITIAALVVACVSVIASLGLSHDAERSARHALALVIPVVVIAFSNAIETGFSKSYRGFPHGGDGPTSGSIIRTVAWLLLAVSVIVHHWMGLSDVPAW